MAKDLVPVLSWLSLGGKCRYCKKPISWQYPTVELATAFLFLLSYSYWPNTFDTKGVLLFVYWLVFLTGFVALIVYDLRWMILPNRVVYPLIGVALTQILVCSVFFDGGLTTIANALFGFMAGSGLFYIIFQISDGKWIGGGDVKLGMLLGIVLSNPIYSLMMIFIASLLGTAWSLPLVMARKVKATSRIPFGPFLVIATIVVYLFGSSLVSWYKNQIFL